MPKAPRLSRSGSQMVDDILDLLFERLKQRLTGFPSAGKRLIISVDRDTTLPHLYADAVEKEGGTPDHDILDRLVDITGNYLDQYREASKAQVKHRVQEILASKTGATAKEALSDGLKEAFDSITEKVRTVIEQETHQAQSIGIRDGIGQMNAGFGISDPYVFFISSKDQYVCKECVDLHLLPDGITPRVWLASEVSSGYHDRGDPNPSWIGLHPNCRCRPATLLPGWGFNEAGRVSYKGEGWDELKHQRGLE